uniref:serine hydrolase domain-containing protein n=1 Tax=Nonomuraea pusilla TaxID=46177 RepID=UPI0006E24404|nr:serine hydrolase domain-containing protein [Nonomuraea pusilla]
MTLIVEARRAVAVVLSGVVALALWAPPPAAAGAADVQDRVNAALRKWMTANGVTSAGLAVMRDNELAGSYGYNQISAETPRNVASLSKAITAVCVMSLIDEGRLRFDTPLRSLPRSFQYAVGRWRTRIIGGITIEQLLRHTSRITYDPTQDGLKGVPNAASSDRTLVRTALSKPLGPSGEHYNNINYAMLGLAIQSITGEPYETYCGRKALAPRGAAGARIGPGTRAMGAFGGWEISAVEYATFARAFDPRARLLSPAAHAFIRAKASTQRATPALGVYVVRTNGGYNLFHHGDWRSSYTSPKEFSAFFAMWDNGISVVVTYDRNVTDAARGALDNALREAAYGRG